MPELPEVETYRLLAESAVGRVISKVDTPDSWYLKHGTTASALRRAMVGESIGGVRRIGKLLLLDIAGAGGEMEGPVLGVRFGMTGSLLVDGKSPVGRLLSVPSHPEVRWERFRARFDDGGSLVVHDPRRLGGVVLDPRLAHLGPDALSITRAQLAEALLGSSAPLKARLLDQSKVAGIGNLIADELLWRAALSPIRPAGSLGPKDVDRLRRQLVRTVGLLMQRGGSHRGDLMEERHVRGRCPKDGAELRRASVGGRTTWWCPVHQM